MLVQSKIEVEATNNPIVSVACGNRVAFALQKDGKLWAWGANFFGVYGNNDAASWPIPTLVGTLFKSIFCSNFTVFGIKKDGSLWGWGQNEFGKLGDNTEADRFSPVLLGNGYIDIAQGNDHTLGLKSDGSLWSWGNNFYGQLGNGRLESSPTPIKVGTDYINIAASGLNSFGIQTDGTLSVWGVDSYLLGKKYGSGDLRLPTIFSIDCETVYAGFERAYLKKSDGTMWCWGRNHGYAMDDGQLNAPDYSFDGWANPIQTKAAYTSISCSTALFTTAINNYGEWLVWGTGYRYSGGGVGIHPPLVIGSGFKHVFTGIDFCFAIKNDGTLWSVGQNDYGQLGDGTLDERWIPQQVLFRI
jgi:Regulator of chromosome condensation (RCC1) repeat